MKATLVMHCSDATAKALEAQGFTIVRNANVGPGAHWFWNPHHAVKRLPSWRDNVRPVRRICKGGA